MEVVFLCHLDDCEDGVIALFHEDFDVGETLVCGLTEVLEGVVDLNPFDEGEEKDDE